MEGTEEKVEGWGEVRSEREREEGRKGRSGEVESEVVQLHTCGFTTLIKEYVHSNHLTVLPRELTISRSPSVEDNLKNKRAKYV